MPGQESNNWLTSKEAVKALRISDCDLMHLRMDGRLEYKKERNAFLYSKNSIDKLKPKAK
jgi:hypothetical protein